MASIVLPVLMKLIVTLAALLGLQYSLFNLVTGSHAALTDTVTFAPFGWTLLDGQRQKVKLRIRMTVVMTAFGLLFIHEAIAC